MLGTRKRWGAVVAAGGITLGAVIGSAGIAGATASVTTQRLAGPDRYGTAAAVASNEFPNGATISIIASGVNYPDALAAAYLSGRLHGPVLLTDPNNLTSTTLNELKTMGSTGVDIVGGPSAVSDSVAGQLKNAGYQVNRIFGSDRYGTAQAIATLFDKSFVANLGTGGPTAILATGLNFADALAAGPLSYGQSLPILLTDPNSLPSSTQQALQSLGIKQVVLMGGTAAVSDAVVTQLQSMGITVMRVAGSDRTQTAAALADNVEYGILNWPQTEANLARGDFYADALACGPLGGTLRTPVVLTLDPNNLGSSTGAFLTEHNGTINAIDVCGGPSAVSDGTVAAAQAAATSH